jgi:hypothetical protein
MATIGAADYSGLPERTTHVLSFGGAGTMWANESRLQWSTIRNLALTSGTDLAGFDRPCRRTVLDLQQLDWE